MLTAQTKSMTSHCGTRVRGRGALRLASTFLVGLILTCAVVTAAAQSSDDREESVWKNLRKTYFGDRPIANGKGVVALDAPSRAEDPAVVPITITDELKDASDRRITKLWLIIDNNPVPMSARFEFGPAAADATIGTRVRVNSYTYMRTIAQTNDDKLYMTKRYVKASGGCSAPVGVDPEKALKHMGEMRLRHLTADADTDNAQNNASSHARDGYHAQLMIRHPNITGLQMDQLTRLVYPAHFVDSITVRKGGQLVFDSHMTFSLSENPSLRFYVGHDADGDLLAQVHDNKDNEFSQRWATSSQSQPQMVSNEGKTQ